MGPVAHVPVPKFTSWGLGAHDVHTLEPLTGTHGSRANGTTVYAPPSLVTDVWRLFLVLRLWGYLRGRGAGGVVD